jgi:hypothetical protein
MHYSKKFCVSETMSKICIFIYLFLFGYCFIKIKHNDIHKYKYYEYYYYTITRITIFCIIFIFEYYYFIRNRYNIKKNNISNPNQHNSNSRNNNNSHNNNNSQDNNNSRNNNNSQDNNLDEYDNNDKIFNLIKFQYQIIIILGIISTYILISINTNARNFLYKSTSLPYLNILQILIFITIVYDIIFTAIIIIAGYIKCKIKY